MQLEQIGMHLSGLRCFFFSVVITRLTNLYFVNQPECINIRILVSEAIFDKLGRQISFACARRVGRKIPNTNS